MDIVEADNGTNAGLPLCFPQVALVNDDYAWALVCGIARGKSDGAVAAGSNVLLDATSGELDTAATGTTAELVHGVVMLQNDGSNDGPIFAMFPSKSTG